MEDTKLRMLDKFPIKTPTGHTMIVQAIGYTDTEPPLALIPVHNGNIAPDTILKTLNDDWHGGPNGAPRQPDAPTLTHVRPQPVYHRIPGAANLNSFLVDEVKA